MVPISGLPAESRSTGFREGIARPARIQFAGNLARAILLFVYQLVIARLFGAAVFGLFSLATSAAQVAGMLSHLGGDYVILRRGHVSQGTLEPARAFRVVFLTAVPAALLGGLLIAGAGAFTEWFGSDERIAFSMALVSPTVLAFAGTTLVASLLQASHRFGTYTLIHTLLEPGLRLAILGGLLLVADSWDVPLWSYTIASLATFAIAIFLVRRSSGEPVKAADWADGIRALTYSVPTMLAFALQFATLFVNLTALNHLASTESAGIYSAALRLAMLSLWAQIAFTTPLLPMVSAGLEGDREQLRSTYQRTVRFVMLINMPLLAALLVGRVPLMAMFGSEFVVGSTALAWMLGGQLVNTATAGIEAMLPLGGKPTVALAINLFQLALNLLLAVSLIPIFGISGAGFATGLAVIVTNLIRAHQVERHWGISPLSRHLAASVGGGAVIVATWEVVARTIEISDPAVAALGALIVGATVLAVCLVVFPREDRLMLYSVLDRFPSVRNYFSKKPGDST